MKNLKQLLGICEHEWVNTEKYAIERQTKTFEWVTHGLEYVQQCKKCMKIRTFQI